MPFSASSVVMFKILEQQKTQVHVSIYHNNFFNYTQAKNTRKLGFLLLLVSKMPRVWQNYFSLLSQLHASTSDCRISNPPRTCLCLIFIQEQIAVMLFTLFFCCCCLLCIAPEPEAKERLLGFVLQTKFSLRFVCCIFPTSLSMFF